MRADRGYDTAGNLVVVIGKVDNLSNKSCTENVFVTAAPPPGSSVVGRVVGSVTEFFAANGTTEFLVPVTSTVGPNEALTLRVSGERYDF